MAFLVDGKLLRISGGLTAIMELPLDEAGTCRVVASDGSMVIADGIGRQLLVEVQGTMLTTYEADSSLTFNGDLEWIAATAHTNHVSLADQAERVEQSDGYSDPFYDDYVLTERRKKLGLHFPINE